MGEAEKPTLVWALIDEIVGCVDHDGEMWDPGRAEAAVERFEAAARLAGAKEALEQALALVCVHCKDGIGFPAGKFRLHLPNPRFSGHRSWCRAWRVHDALSRLRSSSSEPAVKAVGNEKEKP